LKQRVQLLEQSLRSQHQTIQKAQERLEETVKQLPSNQAVEEIGDIPRLKQRIQQMNQSMQSLQEQLLQLKKQTIEAAERPSYSRCSSLRSSVGLNTSAINFIKKQSTKTLRKTALLEQDRTTTVSPKNANSPPRSADSLPGSGPDEKQRTVSTTPSPVHDRGGHPSPPDSAK